MRGYREIIMVYADVTDAYAEIPALPEKIADQYYKTVSPTEFFEIVHDIYSAVPQANPNSDINIQFTDSTKFQVLSLEYIDEEGIKKEIPYIINNQNFTFKSITDTNAIYSLRTKFENGDIINYIFWMEKAHFE